MLLSLFEKRDITQSSVPWNTFDGSYGGTPTWSGVPVTEETALQLLCVYGCARFIADGISTLPIDTYRELQDGTKQEITKPDWLTMPTVDLFFADWCGQVLYSLLIEGNAYIAVMRGERGSIVELVPLDPRMVKVRREAGRKVYYVSGVRYPGELVHIKGLMQPGSDTGLSPLECARQSIGIGLATAEYGAKFFDGDGNMPGVIEAPGAMAPEIMQATSRAWARRRSRQHRGEPGVLVEGATWKATGVTNEQAQFLATRKWTAAEIAGQVFMLDPTELGIPVEGNSQTYQNLEQRSIRKVQVTFLPWLVRIEHAVSALMAAPRFMRFNVNGLLRGDMLTRYQAYQVGIANQFLVPNEAREKEDLAPLPGGDEVIQPATPQAVPNAA